MTAPTCLPPKASLARTRRYTSNPDDIFHADVQRPHDHTKSVGKQPFSFAEESYRKLCAAVIDGRLTSSLLVKSGLDVNVCNINGDTAGHMVRDVPCIR